MTSLFLVLSLPLWAQEPETPETTSDEIVEELPPLVKDPELLEYIQAPYPEKAKEEGLEGVVLLLIEIDEVGDVSFIEVLQSAGEEFDAAAIAAAWQFVFSPAEDANGPTPVQIEFEYGFVLDIQSVEGAIEDITQEIDYPVNLDGQVIEMGTKRPLKDFLIQAELSDGSIIETTTDTDGRYELKAFPAGIVKISCVYPEYERTTQAIEVFEDQRTSLRIWMKNLNYREDELVGIYRKPSADVSRRTLTMEEVRRIPGTFGDPVRVIQNLPGAARSPFGSGLLVIRGANPEDSAVYVDGIRIPIIYHLGGFVSILNADLIDSVDYLPGSYGVKYGRSLGGVVDVKTKEDFPEQNQLSWNTDILDSGGLVQGRVGEWGVAAAARRSYIDALLPIFTKNTAFTVKPRWFDYQFKLDHLERDNGKLSFFLFGFEDKLLVSTPDDVPQGTDPDNQGAFGTKYSTHRGYIKWTHNVNDELQLRLTPSFGIDKTDLEIGGIEIIQSQPMIEIRAESEWVPSEHFALIAGADFITGTFSFEAKLPFTIENLSSYDPLAERDPVSFGGDGYFYSPDFYLQGEVHPLKDADRWILYPGLRYGIGQVHGTDNLDPLVSVQGLDPRLSSRFMATEKLSLKGGVGLYTQWPQPFEVWRPSGSSELDLEKVLSAELGFEQKFTPSLKGDITFFNKKLYDLIVQNNAATSSADLLFTNKGIGRAYGMELIVKQDPVNNIFGWVSYTLSRSERNDDPNRNLALAVDEIPGSPSSGDWYLFDLDQTHILVVVAGYQLPRDIGISSKVQYVTGNPTTPYSGGIADLDQDSFMGYSTANYNSERLAPFFSVNFRTDKTFTFKRWQLETYVDLLNAIHGDNPEFVVYNYDYTESTYIGSLPFIPSIGFESNFTF
jgi:TonB family protein